MSRKQLFFLILTLCILAGALAMVFFLREEDKKDPVVGLALSGGAAWGMAHIGVLEVLEENQIPIDIITGTSAGAIVGAFYASGMSPKDMALTASDLSWNDFLTPTIPNLGFFSTKGLEDFLDQNITVHDFSQLAIKLAVVATDLERGEEFIFQEGPVSKGVAASAAIPVVFEPVSYQGRILVDGGLINNIPDDLARNMGADIVIAVNLSGYSFEGKPENQIEVGLRSFNIIQKYRSRALEADIVITPDLTGISSADLEAYAEMIALGRKAAENALPEIKEKLGLD